MRIRRSNVVLVLTSLTALTLVPVAPSFATEVAPPATVTATVDALPEASDRRETTTSPAPRSADASAVDTTVADELEPDAAGTEATGGPGAAAASDAPAPPVETDVAFSTIGFRLPDGVDSIRFRTRDLDGGWRDWTELDRVDAELDGPDLDAPEATTAATDLTDPAWVGPSDAFQIAAGTDEDGDASELTAGVEAELIDTLGLNEGVVAKAVRHLAPRPAVAPAEASAGRPNIISRAGWGANERLRTWSTSYRNPTFAVLHHTAGSNSYTRAQSPAVVRGIYSYHASTLGWGDIGYNILVDRYGQIYEGRFGGLERGAIGAHARGYNTGSFGVSIMGNFDVAEVPSAAIESVARVTAWKYDVHGIDRDPGRRMTVNGTRINPFTSHRDVGQTACPGRYLYARMGQLRTRIASLATGVPPAGTANATRFADVPRSHPHHDAIEAIAERRVTEGCAPGRYCPSDPVARAQMASFLVRALELPPASGSPFRDIDSGPHVAAVSALAASRITTGCAPGRFCPNLDVTRAQMATFIARAFRIPRAPSGFPDVGRSSDHDGAIGGLVAAGIANGYGDGTFRPNAPVTRAEMAAFLSRALARSGS